MVSKVFSPMCGRGLRIVATCLAVACVSNLAQAQDTLPSFTRGTVVDLGKHPLERTQISAVDSTNTVIASAWTDTNGTFVMRGLTHNQQYAFVIRKLGFAPDTVKLFTPSTWAGDTLWFDVMLVSVAPVLDTVSIKSVKADDQSDFIRIISGISTLLDKAQKLADKMCSDNPSTATTPGFHISLCLQPPTIMGAAPSAPGGHSSNPRTPTKTQPAVPMPVQDRSTVATALTTTP